MSRTLFSVLLTFALAFLSAEAYGPSSQIRRPNCASRSYAFTRTRMSENDNTEIALSTVNKDEEEEPMDEATRIMLEKQRKADELRAQEVFMKKSTGRFMCSNCEFEYDQAKGDSYLIGGLIKPDTPFDDLPANWRCPSCRASKDSFNEIVEEIAGFEVNQGYGFGTNSMTGGEKSSLVWGGLGFLFLLLLSGYALN